jgi:murein DD-endopeptidase MepM/ murein hydrolase activator NlpD
LGPNGFPVARCRARVWAYAVTAVALGAALAAPAVSAGKPAPAASTGGRQVPTATPTPGATPAPSSKPVPFGVSTAAAPAITRADCVETCDGGAARAGSLVRVRGGKDMRVVDQVVFLGADGDGDDVSALPSAARKTSVDVKVPLGAPGGLVAVVDRDGRVSASPAPVVMSAAQAVRLAGGAAAVELAVRAPRAFYGAVVPASLTYVVHAPAPVDAVVEVAREGDGAVVARWNVAQVVPEVLQTATWDGMAGGKLQKAGHYAFRVYLAGIAGPPQPASFEFARDRFPILGPHVFGTGAAAFGGPRGHQGQDVFAACGTPLIAAHAGTVKFSGFQGRAGNYLVIDNDGAATDYGYMHLRDTALVAEGEHVATGQLVGYVGDSGDADGCHLHFEIWTAPGWYAGGHPIDPLPSLKSWDRLG